MRRFRTGSNGGSGLGGGIYLKGGSLTLQDDTIAVMARGAAGALAAGLRILWRFRGIGGGRRHLCG